MLCYLSSIFFIFFLKPIRVLVDDLALVVPLNDNAVVPIRMRLIESVQNGVGVLREAASDDSLASGAVDDVESDSHGIVSFPYLD